MHWRSRTRQKQYVKGQTRIGPIYIYILYGTLFYPRSPSGPPSSAAIRIPVFTPSQIYLFRTGNIPTPTWPQLIAMSLKHEDPRCDTLFTWSVMGPSSPQPILPFRLPGWITRSFLVLFIYFGLLGIDNLWVGLIFVSDFVFSFVSCCLLSTEGKTITIFVYVCVCAHTCVFFKAHICTHDLVVNHGFGIFVILHLICLL